MEKDSQLGIIAQETKDFVNLAVDEAKLKITKGLSTALAQVLAWLVIICILSLVLGLLAFALLQWLNILVGAPWGTLIVAGVFALAHSFKMSLVIGDPERTRMEMLADHGMLPEL